MGTNPLPHLFLLYHALTILKIELLLIVKILTYVLYKVLINIGN